MIAGGLRCSECDFMVAPINPNSGERICLACGNWQIKRTQACCNQCQSQNTKEMFYLAGKDDENCPQCHKGKLNFCI